MPADDEIRVILKDPALSHWLRALLLSALDRDPVDAANDAGLLSLVLDRRAAVIAAEAMAGLALAKAQKQSPR